MASRTERVVIGFRHATWQSAVRLTRKLAQNGFEPGDEVYCELTQKEVDSLLRDSQNGKLLKEAERNHELYNKTLAQYQQARTQKHPKQKLDRLRSKLIQYHQNLRYLSFNYGLFSFLAKAQAKVIGFGDEKLLRKIKIISRQLADDSFAGRAEVEGQIKELEITTVAERENAWKRTLRNTSGKFYLSGNSHAETIGRIVGTTNIITEPKNTANVRSANMHARNARIRYKKRVAKLKRASII